VSRLRDYDVLVACEESGMIRDALRAAGVRAISCDLKPSRRPGPHAVIDVRRLLPLRHWKGMIAHPPCRYLANSGAKHLYKRINGVWAKEHGRDADRWRLMEEGAAFFNLFRDADHIPLRAIENSIMHGHGLQMTAGRPADVITQPWWFGDPFTKAAAWWLYGLPALVRLYDKSHYESIRPKAWYLPPSDDREQKRSETEPATALAVAAQWGPLFRAGSGTRPAIPRSARPLPPACR